MTCMSDEDTNCRGLILTAFANMVASIAKTVTPTFMPHLYHSSATIHEANSVYHFSKSVENQSQHAAVYCEYPCDSGRIDAVILTPPRLLLIEAKSSLSMKKLDELERQAVRLENPNDSLRLGLIDKVPIFRQSCWSITDPCTIWAVLLLETIGDQGLDVWNGLSNDQANRYPTLSTYEYKYKPNPVYIAQTWYHLLAFKRLTGTI